MAQQRAITGQNIQSLTELFSEFLHRPYGDPNEIAHRVNTNGNEAPAVDFQEVERVFSFFRMQQKQLFARFRYTYSEQSSLLDPIGAPGSRRQSHLRPMTTCDGQDDLSGSNIDMDPNQTSGFEDVHSQRPGTISESSEVSQVFRQLVVEDIPTNTAHLRC